MRAVWETWSAVLVHHPRGRHVRRLRFTHFELPAGIIPLVWNGMMSFGGGWFFLAASEAITVLNRELLLPGVGSFMALAVKAADVSALGWAAPW